MQKLWSWTSQHIKQLTSTVTRTVAQISGTIQSIYSSAWLRKSVRDFVFRFSKGATMVNPATAITAAFESESTTKVVVQSLTANFLYLGLAMGYEGGRQYLAPYLPDVGNRYTQRAIDSAAWAINKIIFLMLMRKAWSLQFDNTCHAASLSKAVSDVVPASKHFQPCDETCKYCKGNLMSSYQASLYGYLYWFSDIGTVKIAEWAAQENLPYLGKNMVLPLRALAYGMAFLQYKVGNTRMCAQAKYELLSSNKTIALGIGTLFLGSVATMNFAIEKLFGTQSPYVSDVIFNILFQANIAMAIMNDRPLPDRTGGFDFFAPGRIAMDAWIQKYSADLAAELDTPADQAEVTSINSNLVKKNELQAALENMVGSPRVLTAKRVFLEPMVKRPAFKTLYALNEKWLVEYLLWFDRERRDPIKNKLPIVTSYIPNSLMTPQTKANIESVQVFFDKRWDKVSDYLWSVIKFIREKQGLLNKKDYPLDLITEVLNEYKKREIKALTLKKSDEPLHLISEVLQEETLARLSKPAALTKVVVAQPVSEEMKAGSEMNKEESKKEETKKEEIQKAEDLKKMEELNVMSEVKIAPLPVQKSKRSASVRPGIELDLINEVLKEENLTAYNLPRSRLTTVGLFAEPEKPDAKKKKLNASMHT